MNSSRREFIRQVGALSAGSALASLGAAASPAPSPGSGPEAPFELHIFQTTDVHCQIHPHDELFWEEDRPVFRQAGGYAHLATYFRKMRKAHEHSFFVDTGDMFQGSQLSVETTGKAIMPILDGLAYDLYLPGNWEVIYYKQAMQQLLGGLRAPKVCANMYHDLGEGKRGELIFPPYYIWQVNGVKIGFLGYTDPLVPLRQSPNYSQGIRYTTPEENLAHYVKVLREQEGCAYVLMLAHLGLSQQLHLANLPACEGVDYILGGDTHERVRKPIACKYAKVVEPGAFGSFVGKLSLRIEGGKVVEDRYELVEISTAAYKADKAVSALIDKLEAPFIESIEKVIGYSSLPLYRYFVIENPIDTLVLNALKWKLPEVDIALSNGFRFCPPRSTPDATGKIPITQGYLYDMLPVDSTVRTASVSGQQLLNWLEKELNNVFAREASQRFGGWVIKFQGMSIRFLAFGEAGKRVQEALVGGQALDPERIYQICACERDGDPDDMLCRIRGVKNPRNTPYTLHSVMRDYLAAHSPVAPQPPGAAIALDAPATLLSQVWGVDYKFR
jgi:2',3'-cyclic-nucleotide 2'-phosphodiesterase (5'-nucleotidase family)